MEKVYKIFAINPGSTSTKIAMFENDRVTFSQNVSHDAEKLKEFADVSDQLPYRRETILKILGENGISLEGTDAFAGRGGGLVALTGGTYPVNDILLHHAKAGFTVRHPAMLGAQLAHDFAAAYGSRAFVVNPPDVDEFIDVARVTGLAGIYRESRIHALNQKEVGIRYAASIGKKYGEVNLIIVHIGGGVSVTAHRMGSMIDSNDIVNGDGPMAPTRCGAMPVRDIVKMCFSGKYTEKDMYDKVTKAGGFVDHLGTADCREINARIEGGDKHAKLVYDTFIYQICKYIGSMAVSLHGQVNAIILTGGIARDKYLVDGIREAACFIAPIKVMAGEFEMEALAAGAMRVMKGEEEPKNYTGEPVWSAFDF